MVGAGITGLTAAWALRAHDVVVLEAGSHVGGRMRSEQVEGCPMELGAQFLSSHYTFVPRLAAELGLVLAPVASGTAVRQDGVTRRFTADRPWSQFSAGLLPWSAAPRAAAGLLRVAVSAAKRSTSDLTHWRKEDLRTADEWSRAVLGRDVTDRVLAPTLNGFYFQELAESSAALPAAVAAFGTRPGATLTIPGGLGRLTEALAQRVDVRLETPVVSVSREGGRAVVTTHDTRLIADRVLVALPGAAALAIAVGASAQEARLMSTPYSNGLLVGLPLDRALQKHQLSNAYGVLVHPREPTPIAAVAVASRAHPDLGDRDLLTVMFCDPAARQLAAASDAQVTATAIDALAHLDPTLTPVLPSDAGRARVVRHAQAMPTCPPGHAGAVAAYRTGRSGDPLILAGDYLGFPWTDSAAATGTWAAGAAVSGQ